MRSHTLRFIRGRLPHWEVENGRYFITINRAGAIPAEAAEKIRSLSDELSRLKGGEMLDHRRRIFREMETWLDRSDSVRDLVMPDIAAMLAEAIENRRARKIWNMIEYTIMPSHIHMFFSIGENGNGMISSVRDFKRWTGKQAHKWIELRAGDFWEREWFDHWSRSQEEDTKIIDYIRNNPVKAGLAREYRDWPWQLIR